MKRSRVFLDANVLFTAAHNNHGKAALLMTLGEAGFWLLFSSVYAVEEARRNIARKYPDRLSHLLPWVADLRMAPAVVDENCPDGLAIKHCPIYRAARACRADVLLTGDIRVFGFLMNDREKADGMMIQTVAEFLASQ